MYNFREKELGINFAQDKLKAFRQLIDTGLSFVVLSMPGVGVSYFLKYLVCQNFAHFIHVDLYHLPTLNQHEFYRMFLRDLKGNPDGKSDEQVFISQSDTRSAAMKSQAIIETKEILKNLAAKYDKVVVVFSRFDQLKNDFDANFLSNLQALTTIQPAKIVLIFTSTKPFREIAPDAIAGGNLTFYSKYLYFKLYSKQDLKKLLKIEPQPPSEANLDKLLELANGHNQLLHILLNSQKQQNLLLDHFVKMQMKELIDYLDYHQRKQVQKIALGKSIPEVDEYLLGVGMVRQSTSETIHLEGEKNAITPSRWKTKEFELFTPLLSEYIKANIPVKLPVKESKLFKLLRANIGKTVSKDEIFSEVWSDNPDSASDWALDALIYRLRKHPFMKANNYIIESHKKVGYTLIQI